MTIELSPISSGYSTGLINDNFQAVEDYINNSLLNRANLSVGEANQLELDIDVNSRRLYNLPVPINSHEAARLQDVQNAIAGDTSANLISVAPIAPFSSDTVQGVLEESADSLQEKVIYVDDMSELLSLDTSTLESGHQISVAGSPFKYDGVDFVPLGPINIRAFGAQGNGADDTQALADFFAYFEANGGVGDLSIEGGQLNTTAGISVTPTAPAFIYGGSDTVIKYTGAVTTGNMLDLISPVQWKLQNITIDAGYGAGGLEGQGISASGAVGCDFIDVTINDYRNSAILLSTGTLDGSDNRLIRCRANGGNTARNGFLFSSQSNSMMIACEVYNLDMTSSPLHGLQFKNDCNDCQMIGGIVDGAGSGVSYATDTADPLSGPKNCHSYGVQVRNSTEGAVASRTLNCSIDVIVNMEDALSSEYAVEAAAGNEGLIFYVQASNVNASSYLINTRSNEVVFNVKTVTNFNGRIANITSGDAVKIHLFSVDNLGTTTNPADLVDDTSGGSHILIDYARTLPNTLSTQPVMRFQSTNHQQNWISYVESWQGYSFRANGTDRYQLRSTVFRPLPDNNISLGDGGNRWTEVFAVTGTINTSDEREKQQQRDLSSAEQEAALKLKSMICAFKWNDAVEEKGDNARWHFGVMAQSVQDVFSQCGLDATEYGLFCYDEWEEEKDKDGNVVTEAGNRFGVRYDQLLAFIISSL